MRAGRILIVLFCLLCAVAVTYWPYLKSSEPDEEAEPAAVASTQQPGPVQANRGSDVPEGFTGAVHPLLHGRTKLDVKTTWTPIGKGRDKLDEFIPKKLYALFHDVKPTRPTMTYTERELSAFLPEKV